MNTETHNTHESQTHHPEHGPATHFTIGGEGYNTHAPQLMADDILKDFAGVDAGTHYLVQLHGNHRISFEGKGDTFIDMHDHLKFEVRRVGMVSHEVLLQVATPNGLFVGIFAKTALVSEVIQIVVDDKQLNSEDEFELVHNGTPLKPTDKTLASFGLEGTVKLDLVAVGSGV